jgi:polyphosphate kinase 2 (PPK2 family)
VLVVRVHRELLEKQKLPKELREEHLWKGRYEDITAFEKYLTRNGIAIRKLFLNVSRKEQKRRFLERLENHEKNWKFSVDDVNERGNWDEYQEAYEKMIRNTASKHAPWVVVPADNKWFTRMLVVATIVDALSSMDQEYPEVSMEQWAALEAARKKLEKE